jgi:K+ transporter
VHWQQCADSLKQAYTQYNFLLDALARYSDAEVSRFRHAGYWWLLLGVAVTFIMMTIWQATVITASNGDKRKLKLEVKLLTRMWQAASAETFYFAQRLCEHCPQTGPAEKVRPMQ